MEDIILLTIYKKRQFANVYINVIKNVQEISFKLNDLTTSEMVSQIKILINQNE